MRTIDADAHVIEGAHSWDFMLEADREFTPKIVLHDGREYWRVAGSVFPKAVNVGADTPAKARDMRDVGARLRHMDELGIDVQVLYPTLTLRPYTKNARVELALCRGYNRWLADLWKKGGGRLRWVAMMPFLTMASVRDELAFAKDNGACGIFMRAHETERRLTDSYFHPLFEFAGEFDMPICVHSASGSHTISEFFGEDNFGKFKLATVGSCHALLMEGVPALFPKLRWAFIEVCAQWIPYVLNDLDLRFKRRGERLPEDPLKKNNIYVTCQVTDDLAYILPYAGEDSLIIGTDYGHADTASQIEALQIVRNNGDLAPRIAAKILSENAARLYAL
ncbi:MAG: amidohydrolase family protein [Proteobacteria bacterium]|nr:amidohydrolase family protein [Pseudomonadota bacterium]